MIKLMIILYCHCTMAATAALFLSGHQKYLSERAQVAWVLGALVAGVTSAVTLWSVT